MTYLSKKIAYVTNNQQIVATYYPGDALPSGVNGVEYNQTVEPVLTNAGYYFARPNYDPVPEQYGGFATTNTTPTIIVGVGSSQAIAGYAQFGIQNGYANTYAYLGQYFQQAYLINASGNVTPNTTGILSPFGDFFATQPGPVALVTMPDVDTGEQGTCTVYCVSLQLDANHDGKMDESFNGTDITSTNSPYIFWVNNNYDRVVSVIDGIDIEDDVPYADSPGSITGNGDCGYVNSVGQRIIPNTRDLEDFARPWVCGVTSNLLASLPSNSTITLSWGDVGNPNPNNPSIDVFNAADPDGGTGYLTNETIAAPQIDANQCPYLGRLKPGKNISLNLSTYQNRTDFIWCGVSNGTGALTLTIADANSNVLAQTAAYIQIKAIKQMYERWTVGDDWYLPPTDIPVLAADDGLPTPPVAFQYPEAQSTNTPYILYVHGWNNEIWSKDRRAEVAFKRIYWQGYQGRFGCFRWPTTYGFNRYTAVFSPDEFSYSEYQAWQSGAGLLNLLN